MRDIDWSTRPARAWLAAALFGAIGMCWVLASGCGGVPVSDVMRKAQLATQLAACTDRAYTEYVKQQAEDADAGVP